MGHSRRCHTLKMSALAQQQTSRRLTGWHGMGATHKIDQVHWSGRFLITPPSYVLVGTHEHKLVSINCSCI